MSPDERNEVPQPAPADDCPLSAREQTQNLVIYSINVTLIYVGAPVLYVGITQASLCEKLDASKTVSNLPSTLYFWMTVLPLVVAWYFCAVRHLKPVLVTCYVTAAVTGALVVVTLLQPTPQLAGRAILGLNDWLPEHFRLPSDWVVPAVLLHAAWLGGVVPAARNCQSLTVGVTARSAATGETPTLMTIGIKAATLSARMVTERTINRSIEKSILSSLKVGKGFGKEAPAPALSVMIRFLTASRRGRFSWGNYR